MSNSETIYKVNFFTSEGWQMAQDRYNKMPWWKRLLKRPLADCHIHINDPREMSKIYFEN